MKLKCQHKVDPSNRITNIQWSKNGEAIVVGAEDRIYFGGDGSIAIANVQKRHSGLYRCVTCCYIKHNIVQGNCFLFQMYRYNYV